MGRDEIRWGPRGQNPVSARLARARGSAVVVPIASAVVLPVAWVLAVASASRYSVRPIQALVVCA
jgi:hypothetical protein